MNLQSEDNHSLGLRAGEWVQVRSKEEILQTLDHRGQLEGLPFMPEMFQYCGKRFSVCKRAHKTCDPPNGMGGRRMPNAVHLEGLRCDGQAHGGCQARCLIFWKEAWLERVSVREPGTSDPSRGDSAEAVAAPGGCTENDVWAGTRITNDQTKSDEPIYLCQSTHLSQATESLRWWDARQYFGGYTSRNVPLSQMAAALLFFVYHNLATAGLGVGSAMRYLYDLFQRIRGGTPYPC